MIKTWPMKLSDVFAVFAIGFMIGFILMAVLLVGVYSCEIH